MADSAPVRLTVDPERCIGAGQCEMLEPDTFFVDDDTAVASAIGTRSLPQDRAAVVIDRCPSGAISIVIERDEP
jgi:ferredoxin